MTAGARLAEAIDRTRAIFERKPSAALATKRAIATLRGEAAATKVVMGGHRILVDQPVALGGNDAGPNPGDLLRGALAACLAQQIAMHAPRFQVPLEEIEVAVETDIDLRGATGLPVDGPPGFRQVRYTATLVTAAPRDRVSALLDYVHACNPTVDDLTRSLAVEGRLVLRSPNAIPFP